MVRHRFRGLRHALHELLVADVPLVALAGRGVYYAGDRDTTEKHRETLRVNGWTFAPVDIMDAEGTILLPVAGGKWFTEMSSYTCG